MITNESQATPSQRVDAFCRRFALRAPVLQAPMAGACPPDLAAAVARAGGLGAVLTPPDGITEWVSSFRALGSGPLQINLWTPDPVPVRDAAAEARVARFLERWGPAVLPSAGDAKPPDFAAQFEAILALGPAVVSSIMGLYPPELVN